MKTEFLMAYGCKVRMLCPNCNAKHLTVWSEWLGLGKVVDVIGRFWSLDREENWDRIEKTYNVYVRGEARKVPDN